MSEQIIYSADITIEIIKGKQYGDFASDHEMYAVLLEEVEEVWHEIKNNKAQGFKERLRKELVQVAAVAIRAIQELDEATCQQSK